MSEFKPIKTVDLAWLIRNTIDGKSIHGWKCIASMEMDATITVQAHDGSVHTVKVTRRRNNLKVK
jgi:hypothetical protein